MLWLNPMHVPPEGATGAPSRQQRDGGSHAKWRGSAEEAAVVVGPKRMSVVDNAPRSRQSEDRLDVRTVRNPDHTHNPPPEWPFGTPSRSGQRFNRGLDRGAPIEC